MRNKILQLFFSNEAPTYKALSTNSSKFRKTKFKENPHLFSFRYNNTLYFFHFQNQGTITFSASLIKTGEILPKIIYFIFRILMIFNPVKSPNSFCFLQSADENARARSLLPKHILSCTIHFLICTYAQVGP